MSSIRSATGWSSSPPRSAPSSNGTISSSTARWRRSSRTHFFPTANPTAALPADAGDVRRRLRRAAARRDPVRHPRRQARAQIYLPRHHHPDGLRHRGGRRCCRPTPRSASPRRSCSSSAGCCRGSRSAANMAARRSTSPSMRRANKRGLYTSFIQASVIGGFLLSVVVVLATNALVERRGAGRLGAGGSPSSSRCCCSPSRSGCG